MRSMKFAGYKWLLLFAALVAIIALLTSCTLQTEAFKSKNGAMDLTEWEFSRHGNVQLDGQWEFYWNKLLNYQDFSSEKPDMTAEVPNAWNKYELKGESLPGQGYATYRLHVKTKLPANTVLGLKSHTFSSASRIYINEKLVASNGVIGTNIREETGEYRPQAITFGIPAGEFDIIIQVSNFQYARGGFWDTLYLGEGQAIQDLYDNAMGKELFLLGALLVIALFNIAIYFLVKDLKYTLYFALLCLSTIVTVDMIGQYVLPRIFPAMELKTVIFLWYTAIPWSLVILQLFVAELFPSTFAKYVVRIYLTLTVAETILFILTQPVYYTHYGQITNYIEMLGVLCSLIIVAVGIKQGKKDGWLQIVSMLILLVTHLHDVLYTTNIISSKTGEIFFVGLFLFIFMQMLIEAKRIKVYHEQKRAADLAFLQAQIKPHFLYNTLNTIIAVSYYDIEKARKLLGDFSQYLRRSIDFKSLSQFVPLKNEVELAKAYLEIEKARFEERLEVSFEVPEDLDTRVPILVLQPIIENAVIHGILPKPEGGRLDVAIQREGDLLIFKVMDNGIGLKENELQVLTKLSKQSGVGLENINERLCRLYGQGLHLKSIPTAGTEVSWSIPIGERR